MRINKVASWGLMVIVTDFISLFSLTYFLSSFSTWAQSFLKNVWLIVKCNILDNA